jgi:hypothetical protein
MVGWPLVARGSRGSRPGKNLPHRYEKGCNAEKTISDACHPGGLWAGWITESALMQSTEESMDMMLPVIVIALRTDGNHRYSWIRNRRPHSCALSYTLA